MKRSAMWVVAAVIAVWFVQEPGSADHIVHVIGTALGQIAASLAAFARGL